MRKFASLVRKGNNLNKTTKVFASTPRGVYEKEPTEFVKGLSVEVRKNLKENVLKVLDSKDDAVLKKKLNLAGVLGSCRLNVAKDDLLNQVTGDNILKILKFELENPWIYYWTKICKNGNDASKWLESLKEMTHTSAGSVECVRQMMLHGAAPDLRHYNLCLDTCATHLDGQNFADEWDRLQRRPDFDGMKPDEGTFNALLKMNVLRNDFNLGLSVIEVMQKKGFTPLPEYVKACEEGVQQTSQEEIELYFKDGTLPKVYAESVAKQTAANEYHDESLHSCLVQPPLEKLQNL